MRKLRLDINCGEKTCAAEKGIFCEWLGSRKFGQVWECMLFNCELRDENGRIEGWLQRCDECMAAERADEK